MLFADWGVRKVNNCEKMLPEAAVTVLPFTDGPKAGE